MGWEAILKQILTPCRAMSYPIKIYQNGKMRWDPSFWRRDFPNPPHFKIYRTKNESLGITEPEDWTKSPTKLVC